MTIVRFFGFGRARLCKGMPLRALLLLESRPDSTAQLGLSSAAPQAFSINFKLVDPERSEVKTAFLELRHTVRIGLHVNIEVYTLELSTDGFLPGAYDVEVTRPQQIINAPEVLWILSPQQYRELMVEAIGVPGLHEVGTSLDGPLLDRL